MRITIDDSEQCWVANHFEEVVRDAAEVLREQPPGREPVDPADWKRAIAEIGAMHQLGIVLDGGPGVISLGDDGLFPPMQLRPWVERWIATDREDVAAIEREIEVNDLKREDRSPAPLPLVRQEADLRGHLAEAQTTLARGLALLVKIDTARAEG